jgi:hypothetical protein
VTLLADGRSGAGWIMSLLDRHPAVCASGKHGGARGGAAAGFTSDALMPHDMAWLSDASTEKSCNYHFVLKGAQELISDGMKRCAADYDAENDPLKLHLPRLCRFVGQLPPGDYSEAAIVRLYVEAYRDGNRDLLACSCPGDTTSTKVLRVMSDWNRERLPLNETALAGSRVIRLTRRNLLEKFFSFRFAQLSGEWTIRSPENKRQQIEKIRAKNWTVDVDNMMREFDAMTEKDREADAWAEQLGGGSKVLTIDYDDCRSDKVTCLKRITQFMGVDNSFDPFDSEEKWTYNHGSDMLQHVTNQQEVETVLAANGWGHWIGITEHQPVQHLIYQPVGVKRITQVPAGINATVLDRSDAETKYASVLPVLKTVPPDSLVVISDGDGVSLNSHLRSLSQFYKMLTQFRANLESMTGDSVGAVVVSTESQGMAAALTHVQPGDLFSSSSTNSRRKKRACQSGRDPTCLYEANDDKSTAAQWKSFLEDRALKHSSTKSKAIYLDASMIAGKAGDLIRILETLDIGPDEDDRAVWTDFIYRHPKKVVLDYEQKLFGKDFDGVHHQTRTNRDCPFWKEEDDLWPGHTETAPLFVHGTRDLGCTVASTKNVVETYPKWDETGIEIKPILDHVHELFVEDKSTYKLDRHFHEEFLYVVDERGMWTTSQHRDRYRVMPTDKFLLFAHKELLKSDPHKTRWSVLRKTIQQGGFLYWAWYGDFKYCAYKNMGYNSIPLFTTSATSGCTHAFPTPAYMNIIDSQPSTRAWYKTFQSWDADYPWESKLRKVVWRGGLTENNADKVFDSVRWRLCKLVHEELTGDQKDMFDVGLTDIPVFLRKQIDIDADQVGGLVEGIKPMNNFMTYQAVLDCDGNSWSSRFGTLLCYNSVTIKVEPLYVDYFFHDLIPWKHYVPVRADLSDLVENVAYVLDPMNEHIVKEIVAAANQWCAERFTRTELSHDMLDIWESYVRMLDKADPNWQDQWKEKKMELFSDSSPTELIPLQQGMKKR